ANIASQPMKLTGKRETIARKTYIRAPKYPQASFDKALAQCRADATWHTHVNETSGHDVMIDQPQWLAEKLLKARQSDRGKAADGLADRRQRRFALASIRAAGLGHVGAATAALAAQGFRRHLHQIDSADLGRQVVGDTDHYRSLAISRGDKG